MTEHWVTMNLEKHKDFAKFFDWNNVHQMTTTNDTIEEKMKHKNFKENLLVGALPQNAKDFLNASLFDEYQTSFSPANVKTFKDIQN